MEHVLFRCTIHDDCRTQLIDVVDDIWISATAKNFVHSKAHVDRTEFFRFCHEARKLHFKGSFVSIFSHH